MNNKRGFTLVEVLAVIVILVLIITIVATNGFGLLNKGKEKIQEMNFKAIQESVKLLQVDIENCDDMILRELKDSSIDVPEDCDALKKQIKSKEGGAGINVSIKQLSDMGYLSGTEIEDITLPLDKSIITIYSDAPVGVEKVFINKKLLNNYISNYGKDSVKEIHFVNYISDSKDMEPISDGVGDYGNEIYIWEESSGTIYIGSKGIIYAPEKSSGLFMNYDFLTNIYFENFNTSEVTDMSKMFSSNKSLVALNLSNFNTSKVTTMYRMFWNCISLENLDLNSFETHNVLKMNQMFNKNYNLQKLDLNNFNTSSVTTMDHMFSECKSLTSLDVSNFDTSAVKQMGGMFYGMDKLTQLILGNFNTSEETNMSGMFANLPNLKQIQINDQNSKTLIQNILPSELESQVEFIY